METAHKGSKRHCAKGWAAGGATLKPCGPKPIGTISGVPGIKINRFEFDVRRFGIFF